MGSVNEAEAVEQLTPWMRKLASRYAGRPEGALFDDLVQEGAIGVVQAARTWREDGGASFLTHATTRMRCRMRRRLGRSSVVTRSNRDREMAGHRELPVTMSMDTGNGDQEESPHERDGRLATPAAQESSYVIAERAAAVRRVLSTLPERDSAIVMAVMEGADYRSAGRRFGCSFSLIKQVVDKWTPTLRKRLAKELDHVGV